MMINVDIVLAADFLAKLSELEGLISSPDIKLWFTPGYVLSKSFILGTSYACSISADTYMDVA